MGTFALAFSEQVEFRTIEWMHLILFALSLAEMAVIPDCCDDLATVARIVGAKRELAFHLYLHVIYS